MYQANATQVINLAIWKDVVLRMMTNVFMKWVNGNHATKLPIAIIQFNMVIHFVYKTPVYKKRFVRIK